MAYSDTLREEISRLHIDEGKTAKEILASLADNPAFQDDLPSERTAQRMIKTIADRYTPEQQALDQPWQLRPEGGDGIKSEDIPMIFDVLKALAGSLRYFYPTDLKPHQMLTVRRVRWIAKLRCVMAGAAVGQLWFAVETYSHRERWAAIEDQPFQTADIDCRLAFTPWRSDSHLRAYEEAASAGLIPELTIQKMIRDEYPLDPQRAEQDLEEFKAAESGGS